MADPFTAAFLIISAVSAGASVIQQRKAAKIQRKQNEVSNRIAANQRIRSVKRSIAAGRVRRGQIQASGFAQGVAGGSAVQGATGALASDQGSAIGASNQQFTGQVALTDLSNQISSAQSSAQTFGAVSRLAATGANPQVQETFFG